MSDRVVRWAAAGVFAVLAATIGSAQQNAADDARLKKLDEGPKTIDVKAYPAEQQQAYKLFQSKCVTCHAIARGVNTEMVLPSEWERYIKRMMYKPNSGISTTEGRTLFRFLVYDASVRKTDVVRKALALLPATDRTAAIARIKEVNPAFVAP